MTSFQGVQLYLGRFEVSPFQGVDSTICANAQPVLVAEKFLFLVCLKHPPRSKQCTGETTFVDGLQSLT